MASRFAGIAQALHSSRIGLRPIYLPSCCSRTHQLPRAIAFSRNFSQTRLQLQKLNFRTPPARAVAVKRGSGLYPEILRIYDAGEVRSGWFLFWKSSVMLQCAICCFFGAPFFYYYYPELPEWERVGYTCLIAYGSLLPMALILYVTGPFVKRIRLHLPLYARRSHKALLHYSTNLPPEARIEFTTLRFIPVEKRTTCFIGELRSISPPRFPVLKWPLRHVNIERVKPPDWYDQLWITRAAKWFAEPKWKFHVLPGRLYEIQTGVEGVWTAIAKRIRDQTVELNRKGGGAAAVNVPRKMDVPWAR